MNPNIVGNWLKETGANVCQVADALGVSRQNIYDKLKPERKPNFRSIYKIAQVLGYRGKLVRKNAPAATVEDIYKMTEGDKQLSYDTVEELMNLLGYEIVFTR